MYAKFNDQGGHAHAIFLLIKFSPILYRNLTQEMLI